MSDSVVTPNPWLWKPRTKPIRFIEIHSTRGGSATPMTDYVATMNWMVSKNNTNKDANGKPLYEWGSSCSYVLGPSGQMCTVLDDDKYPTHGAGYGGAGSTYSIDEYGIAYEWAQPNNLTPFSDAMYRRGAKEVAIKIKRYGIPAVFISIPRQAGSVPTGIVRHDRCENGVKLGKTDPGVQFNEALFLTYLNAELQEEDMTPEQAKTLNDIWHMLFDSGANDETNPEGDRRLIRVSKATTHADIELDTVLADLKKIKDKLGIQ